MCSRITFFFFFFFWGGVRVLDSGLNSVGFISNALDSGF